VSRRIIHRFMIGAGLVLIAKEADVEADFDSTVDYWSEIAAAEGDDRWSFEDEAEDEESIRGES